jgi:adenine-specific DNA-methyltransferase
MQKIEATSHEAQSADITAENIAQLKALFPELLTESVNGVAINVDVLKQLVGDATATDTEEKYGLNWHGKRRARQLALTPSTGTLRPCVDESVDWETTQNLMIEGDNLEVLKLLQKSYAGKVKMIYIDPPYNTGKDFVYPDNFQDNIKNYLELTGQVEGGRKISSNTEASGRFHTDWMSMMYPRLKLARNLLREDGIIFISVDDNEVADLRVMMNELWGEENSLVPLIWSLPRGINAGHISRAHEYILVYAKNREALNHFRRDSEAEFSIDRCNKKIDARHPASDITFPAGIRFEGTDKTMEGDIKGSEKITIQGVMKFKDGKLAESVTLTAGWTMKDMILDWLSGKVVLDTKGQPIVEFFFKDNGKLYSKKETGVQTIKSILKDVPDTQAGRKEIEELFGSEDFFDYPKPSGLIQKLISLATEGNDIILDFFGGSGTSAHAAFASNALDQKQRRFIVVQLPEPAPVDSLMAEEGFTTISSFCIERLRRAGAKVKADNPMFAGDTGFRVFKLDTSNIRAWNPDRDNLEKTLLDHEEHILPGRTEADIVYELLLKLGLDLCVPIVSRNIAGKTVGAIGGGVLFACLAERITAVEVEALAQGIVAWHKELATAGSTTCVFRDSAFENDIAKSNLAAILEQYGIANVRSL